MGIGWMGLGLEQSVGSGTNNPVGGEQSVGSGANNPLDMTNHIDGFPLLLRPPQITIIVKAPKGL